MNSLRCFIAVELPAEVKDELSSVQTNLKNGASCPVRWVQPDSIHLTLCFLGEISPEHIERTKDVMARAVLNFSPFSLRLSRAGAFPNLKQPRTVWVGLEGDTETLSRFQKRLEDGLRVMGYAPESRSFRPHLTLARVRDEATAQHRLNLGTAIMNLPPSAPRETRVISISLMKSDLLRSGAVYTALYSAGLKTAP